VQALREWREKSISIFTRTFSAYNYLIIYLFILVVFNIVLLNLPLTNYLGYEFSIFNSAIIILQTGIFSILYLKKNTISNETKKKAYKTLVYGSLIFLLLPFFISFFSLFKTIICPIKDGIIFYAFLTLPAPVIGIALGILSFSINKRFSLLIFFLSLFLIALIPVFEIYFNPQIYFYNPIVGFFPGTIYDEGLGVDLKLMIYRILNLLFFGSVIFLIFRALISSSKLSKRITWAYSIIVPVAFIILSPDLGYSTTTSRIKAELDKTILTENYEIHYSSELNDTLINVIALHNEFYYSELEKYFKVKPKKKISVLIFNDEGQKKLLFGTANADVAKPWLNSIYVSYDSWEITLKHEIAHCFTAGFGSGVFKLAGGFNPALIEGLAEAADGFYDENSIHYLAALAYKSDYRINLSSLFSSFSFFGSVSSLSYIYSGSFIKYLISEFGIEKVKHFYRINDFNESFSTDLNGVVKNYEMFLDTLDQSVSKDKANYYFGRKSLISKVCPRFVSSSLTTAWEFYSKNNYEKAQKKYKEILSKAENYSAVVGLAKIYEDTDSLNKAIKLFRLFEKTFSGTSTEYDLKFRLAELNVKNSELDRAKELYYLLSNAKPSRRIESLAGTRISLMQNGSIKNYVEGSDYDKYSILKVLNSKSYNYYSIPLMIDLSASLEEDYHEFLQNFENDLEVKDELSSYAIYKLSEYMLKNFDYLNARKIAGLALRYKGNSNLLKLTEENYKKTEWFFRNAEKILAETKFELN